MKICKRIKIKHLITVWMQLSFILLGVLIVVHAAYNGTASVKRVVSTQASRNSVFSSNYMESGELVVKNLRTTSDGYYICNVTVCNYDQLDPSKPARALITYSFTAELMEYNRSTGEYQRVTSIQKKDDESDKVFFVQKAVDNNVPLSADTVHNLNTGSFYYTYTGETLIGESSCKDSFNICFDSTEVNKDIPDLFIKVTATPTAESVQLNGSLPTLSSVISISKGHTVETGWHGSLNESSISNYDAYNLVIEGSGKGTIDILWDSREFTINPAFLDINSSKLTSVTDASSTGWKTVTLSVDSSERNRYIVQFYKVKTNTDYTGNDFPSRYILCSNYEADDGESSP